MNDENIDSPCEHDCHYQLRSFVNEMFEDYQHRVIGDLRIKWNKVHWTPSKSDVVYVLSILELGKLMQQHCVDPDKHYPLDDTFREYAPLRPENALKVRDLTPEQLARLRQLNTRLKGIEEQLAREVQPQLTLLNARVADPDDWLQEYECECVLEFSLGENDPDYDADNSENIIVRLVIDPNCGTDVRESFRMDGTNWNEFEGWKDHPMRDEVHCHIYHSLYDHTCIGWANLLRIDKVRTEIKYTHQRIERGLGHE